MPPVGGSLLKKLKRTVGKNPLSTGLLLTGNPAMALGAHMMGGYFYKNREGKWTERKSRGVTRQGGWGRGKDLYFDVGSKAYNQFLRQTGAKRKAPKMKPEGAFWKRNYVRVKQPSKKRSGGGKYASFVKAQWKKDGAKLRKMPFGRASRIVAQRWKVIKK